MLDRTPTDSGSKERELQLEEVMVFVAKLVVVSGICRCTTLYCLNELNNTYACTCSYICSSMIMHDEFVF